MSTPWNGSTPAQGGSKVVVLGVEATEPFDLAGRSEVRRRLLGERPEVRRVLLTDGIQLARLVEPFEGVLADRLQHPEAGFAVGHLLLQDQALRRQRVE